MAYITGTEISACGNVSDREKEPGSWCKYLILENTGQKL